MCTASLAYLYVHGPHDRRAKNQTVYWEGYASANKSGGVVQQLLFHAPYTSFRNVIRTDDNECAQTCAKGHRTHAGDAYQMADKPMRQQ